MRKAFAKRLAAMLLALCVLASLPIATAFADGKTFTVTFYGGEYGVYSQAFVERMQKSGTVSTTGAENSYTSVTVEIPAGTKLPALPSTTAEEGGVAELRSISEEYGVMPGSFVEAGNTKPYVADDPCMSNYSMTPTFYLAGDTDIQYAVRFLLNGTETEVAATQFGKAPATAFPMTLAVPAGIAEYTLDMAATLTANGLTEADGLKLAIPADGTMPTFTFCYTQIVHVTTTTEYVDGDVVVNYNDVNLVGGAGVVGGGDGGAGDGGEEIPDEETPQAGGEDIPDESTPQAGGEEIPDESTPEAGGETAQAGVSMPMVIGGVVGLLAILLIVLVALRKRKGGQEEE